MDDQNLITDVVRNTVYNDLFNTVYAALEKGEISEPDAQKTAEFISPRLDGIKSKSELITFLEELAQKWPIYSNIYLLLKSEYENKTKLNQIQNELTSLTQ